MDPTAPHDTQNPQSTDPSEGGQNQSTPDDLQSKDSQDNSIQPGQFVVAGEDTTATSSPPKVAQNPSFASQPQSPPQGPNIQESQTPTSESLPVLQPVAGLDLAGNSQLDQNVPPQAPVSQPDPTPFAPPLSPQPTQETAAPPPESRSKIQKLKIIAIIVAVLVLIGIIVALVWFFVLGKQKKEPVKTDQDQVIQEEPSPSPARTDAGFGNLSQATPSAPPPVTPSPSP
ncbi:hypothetical protein A3B51_00520 [Candidatus Curtissbacteria bacterium RIFCSPLOWO2_01_FULL_41_18]|uniref:Uncharacterized protein n=1 Tax=Candidatus Curtissbacteria bacterium RIFCSPLOWO2_01_FULL_41_18 TaxID=1797727 RepID=A0A1F5HLG6_9BACT|nr:MAG: hypothetical protein A3B51_00520 [Candidatus Curtissbacteria bacterium RIFCSPLOWO2_01_FULL_41_18]